MKKFKNYLLIGYLFTIIFCTACSKTTEDFFKVILDSQKVKNYIENKKVDVNVQDEDGNTTLHYAIYSNPVDIESINFLLENGAHINIQNNKGETPLHWTLTCGPASAATCYSKEKTKVFDFLLKKGADPKIKDNEGKTVLDKAILGSIEWTQRALKLGTDINTKDDWSNTALHYAVQHPDRVLVELLLSKNANVNLQNIDGNTPLHLLFLPQEYSLEDDTLKKERENIFAILIKAGADRRIKNREGKTAEDLLKEKNRLHNNL